MKGGHVKRIRTNLRRGMGEVRQFDPSKPTHEAPRIRAAGFESYNYSQMRELFLATPFRSKGIWRKVTTFGSFVSTHRGRKAPPPGALWFTAADGPSAMGAVEYLAMLVMACQAAMRRSA